MRAFISYSHKDADALNRLHVHLTNLQREGLIDTWYDRQIMAGAILDDEINQELEKADLFLLMVSPDFIASNYCVEQEMQRALERHNAGDTRVVPIIVEPCDWAAMPQLRSLKAIPKDGKPISEWTNENTAYLDIVQEIRRVIEASGSNTPESVMKKSVLAAPQQAMPRYRVQRDFDEIDRSEYRDATFTTIREYFQRAIGEIDAIEGLRGRFVDRGTNSFGSTVVNRSRQHGIAHITVHCQNAEMWGDISYSFSEDAGNNTANGGFSISFDEYEQFLTLSMSAFGNEPGRLSPEKAAEYLWHQFIEQAGITHA